MKRGRKRVISGIVAICLMLSVIFVKPISANAVSADNFNYYPQNYEHFVKDASGSFNENDEYIISLSSFGESYEVFYENSVTISGSKCLGNINKPYNAYVYMSGDGKDLYLNINDGTYSSYGWKLIPVKKSKNRYYIQAGNGQYLNWKMSFGNFYCALESVSQSKADTWTIEATSNGNYTIVAYANRLLTLVLDYNEKDRTYFLDVEYSDIPFCYYTIFKKVPVNDLFVNYLAVP